MYGEVDTARRVRRGGAIELRASRLVLVGASALALAGCRSATAPVPPVPEKVFSFEARNEIQQTGADPVDAGNAQVGVMFSVSLPDSVSPADLAKIQQVDVLWPNKYVRTPILGGFQVNGDSLTASQLLADRTDGLPKGFYTLEVQFTDPTSNPSPSTPPGSNWRGGSCQSPARPIRGGCTWNAYSLRRTPSS
jgi:hypothetical protein